jgi:hypothetical protein
VRYLAAIGAYGDDFDEVRQHGESWSRRGRSCLAEVLPMSRLL